MFVKTIESAVRYIYDDFETVVLQEYFRDKLEEENLDYATNFKKRKIVNND